jgi:1,4-alpha-glucan branching enzyme
LVYEAHVGMAREAPSIGTYADFRREVLPGIVEAGYNTIQLMAIQEHPYYGSFGYHVSNFFAPSSRFGTPTELKQLIDAAHGLGLRVIMDLVHSHAVRNEVEGIGRYDGTQHQFFHEGRRGIHEAWDSYCFDYGKPEVVHFLLSNCRYWLDEFRLDGFRFDGVTSMLYRHHGLGVAFTRYDQYFDDQVDPDALVYLALANRVIHAVRPQALTLGEDVSGMPGIAADVSEGGCGFDYRLAMGVTDMWFKLMDLPDENWPIGTMWYELTNRRADERTISYLECHDQAIVGGQTAIFRLIGNAMYDAMHVDSDSVAVDRGTALHKMMRCATVATAGHGYLNFMGNEFGHPEWVDFPREGNQWSYHHARRLWSLRDNRQLRYHFLAAFDRDLMHLVRRFRLFQARPQLIRLDEERKLLAFERNGLFVFLNFHPSASYEHCAFGVLPGTYELLLDSDAEHYGGQGRVLPSQTFFTQSLLEGRERRALLRLYLPCRSALVLERLDSSVC